LVADSDHHMYIDNAKETNEFIEEFITSDYVLTPVTPLVEPIEIEEIEERKE
jgi:hypothetical protein